MSDDQLCSDNQPYLTTPPLIISPRQCAGSCFIPPTTVLWHLVECLELVPPGSTACGSDKTTAGDGDEFV